MSKEKRSAPRGQVSATMVLLDGDRQLGSFRVLNLSVGGALLVGRAPGSTGKSNGKSITAAKVVDVLVRLSTGRTVRAAAKVVREESVEDSSVFAIEFTGVSADDREAIDSLVLTAVEDETDPTALVVAESAERRSLLRRQLKGLGRPSFAVSTLEDALRFLQAPNVVEVALVDLSLEKGEAEELLRYLSKKHPRVRRVGLAGSGSPAAAALVEEIVKGPLTRESLARVLND